jgi:DNA-binding transcriptional MerR regulator
LPKPRAVLNAFTPAQASRIVGMSNHMLNYLAREGYLVPHYFRTGKRGRTRYYSYRDLVIARLMQRLLDCGLEIKRLKKDLRKLSAHPHWSNGRVSTELGLLATDGRRLFFVEGGNKILDLTNNGQMAFAFVLDVVAARKDIEVALSADQRREFDLVNRPIRYA